MVNQKSNAPLICGVIGFILGIPAILCGAVCSAMCAGATQTVNGETTGAFIPFFIFLLSWIAGFVLSFFAKGKSSNKTGGFTILCGIVVMIAALLIGGLTGLASGILYIISGGIAISNHKKA